MWKASFVVLAALVAVAVAGMMVGAPTDIDVNDERAQNALSFAVGEHNKRTNDMYLRGVGEVLHVTRQVRTVLYFSVHLPQSVYCLLYENSYYCG